ncbi:MAG: sulfate adenylyltransferase subunit 1 [Tepidisphaerales bacterium]
MPASLLRLVTCGSVDDGKSTLIGRLLYDAKGIFEDQLAAIEKASARYGTTGGGLDLALLTDGLKAEREQGITIDVAYRYFSTPRRPFIIADCPGHEQYTRNMATGASTADLAILLIDARNGVLTQTRRHAYIVALLGIQHVVLAINKMDLVGWSQEVYARIVADFGKVAAAVGLRQYVPVPMSALTGDNVTSRSPHTPWYAGQTLLEHLESVEPRPPATDQPFRLPVQLVSRPDMHFRGYMGEVAAGVATPGKPVVILPADQTTRIAEVFTPDGPADAVPAGHAATVTLQGQFDASRGDVIADAEHPPTVAQRVLAHLVWFSPEAGRVGALYRLKHATRLTLGTLAAIRHRVDINTLAQQAADRLHMNDIALCEIESSRPLVFDPYSVNRTMGAFILIDRVTSNTVAAGMIVSAAPAEVHTGPVTAFERIARLGQRAAIVSVLGPPERAAASAVALDRLLFNLGHLSAVVDEDDEARRAAAIKALNAAGAIAIVVGPASSSRHILRATADPHTDAEAMFRELSRAKLLTAQPPDFEI